MTRFEILTIKIFNEMSFRRLDEHIRHTYNMGQISRNAPQIQISSSLYTYTRMHHNWIDILNNSFDQSSLKYFSFIKT